MWSCHFITFGRCVDGILASAPTAGEARAAGEAELDDDEDNDEDSAMKAQAQAQAQAQGEGEEGRGGGGGEGRQTRAGRRLRNKKGNKGKGKRLRTSRRRRNAYVLLSLLSLFRLFYLSLFCLIKQTNKQTHVHNTTTQQHNTQLDSRRRFVPSQLLCSSAREAGRYGGGREVDVPVPGALSGRHQRWGAF